MDQAKWDSILTTFLCDRDAYRCFMSIPEFKEDLFNHSINVAFLSIALGSIHQLGINELKELFIAALLHDVGKVYISKEILDKPEKLTVEERKIVELHSIIGYAHLKIKTKLSDKILFGVLEHHERVDGSGYNQNKMSDEISEYAKIISIADVYDAMTSDRVYHKSIPKEIVYSYLSNNAGTQFDKVLAEKFLKHVFYIDIDDNKEKFRKLLKDKIKEGYASISY